MSELKPGLYKATVRGVADQIVMVDDTSLGHTTTPVNGCRGHSFSSDITDARPLIVIVLENPTWATTILREISGAAEGPTWVLLRAISNQIEAQTKPARIPEPGPWGVVRASSTLTRDPSMWVRDHHGVCPWVSVAGYVPQQWRNLIDPTLVREGVN